MRRAGLVMVVLALLAALAPAAEARDPGRWVLSGASSLPNEYWQGLTSDPGTGNVFFVGVFEGLWRTDSTLGRTAGVGNAIPASVKASAGYNHIGDPTWDGGEGGRVLLPLECYTPGVGNTCGTGAFAVADPATLAWRYYVKLDPTEIPKAMWAEASPDGKLVWTSSGNDLLAYRTSDVSAAHAAPAGAPIRAARRLAGAVPPSGVTGAVFEGDRLLLAGSTDAAFQVWSVDTRTGKRRLEVELELCGEAEGLDDIEMLGGELHWLIGPDGGGCELTYGPSSALLHLVHRVGRERLRVRIARVQPGPVVRVRVKRRGRPVARARVNLAGARARTNRNGRATLRPQLALPGRFAALAHRDGRWGRSALVSLAP